MSLYFKVNFLQVLFPIAKLLCGGPSGAQCNSTGLLHVPCPVKCWTSWEMQIWQPSADSPLHPSWVHTLVFYIGQQWSRTLAVAALQPTRETLLHFDVTSHHNSKWQCPVTVQPHSCCCHLGLNIIQPYLCPLSLVKPWGNELLLMELYNTKKIMPVYLSYSRNQPGWTIMVNERTHFFKKLHWTLMMLMWHFPQTYQTYIIESKAMTSS